MASERVPFANPVKFGDDLELDPGAYELRRAGRPLTGCGKTQFEAGAVPRNSLVSTAQPDKKKACVEKTSSSWMCSAT